MNVKIIFVAMSVFCGIFALSALENQAHAKKGITLKNQSGKNLQLKYYFTGNGCTSGGIFSKKCSNNKRTTLSNGASKILERSFKGSSSQRIQVYCKTSSGGWKHIVNKKVKKSNPSKTLSSSNVSACASN